MLTPPLRWGSGSVIGNGLSRRRRLSEALVKQTAGGQGRDVINDTLFPEPIRTPDPAPGNYEDPWWTDDGILQLSDAGLGSGALAASTFDPVIYLVPQAATGFNGNALSTDVSVTVTATGVVGRVGSASTTTVTVTTTAAAVVGRIGSASTTAVTVGLTAAGTVGKIGNASAVAETVTVTAAGATGITGAAATTAVTVGLTAAGSVSSGLVGDATLTETVTTTAAGNVATFGDATRTVTVTTTAAGVVNRIGAASLTATVTTTAAGTVGKLGAATVSETVTITAAGTVALTGGATATTVTVTVAAAGVVEAPTPLDASLSLTVVTTAAGVIQRMFFSAPAQSFKRGRRYGTQDSWWLSQSVGVTVWRKDGVWHEQISPPPWVTEGADRLYVGGRAYEISLTEQSELVAAGFGDGIYLG